MFVCHDDGLWTLAAPHSMMGMRIGTRMTVVRLADGGLLLHSPVPISADEQRELESWGKVSHIVAPNDYHHLYVADALSTYPDAVLHGPATLARKRKDLSFAATLDEASPHPAFARTLRPLTIGGCMLNETVFLHEPSGTVISSDLTENFTSCDHWPTRMYLKAAGIYQTIGWSKPLRMLYRDHEQARRDIDRLLAWDFDRVIIAHGDVIESDGQAAIRQTFSFLG